MARQTFAFNSEMGMTLIPGIRARKSHEAGAYLISANADGFRDDEFVVERQPGTRRILLYGDSFAFGAGVAKEDRFGELIAASIPNVEVYNFGIVGSGIDQQLLAHRFVGSKLDYDLVLLAPWVEDAKRNLQQYKLWNRSPDRDDGSGLIWMPKPYFEVDASGSLELHNYPVPPPIPYGGLDDVDSARTDMGGRLDYVRWRLRKYHPGLKGAIQRVTRYQPAKLYDSPDNPGWVLTRAILEQWIDEADAPVLICPIPMYQHIEGASSATAATARFAEFDRSVAGAHVFDALPALKRRSLRARRGMRFASDIHFSPAGHRAFAEAIVEEIARVLHDAGDLSASSTSVQ